MLIAMIVSSVAFANGVTEEAADVKWPSGNVNVIVPAAPGGGTDLVARKFAQVAVKVSGNNFIVVNQGDGGGSIAYNTVYEDDADGLSLGLFIPSFFTTYITGQVDENPMTDYKIACYVDRITAHYICVRKDSPYKTIEDLISSARKNPGKVSFGTSIGSRSHFKQVEWAQAAGIEFKWVEAGKTSAAISALLGGHIDVIAVDAANAMSYAKSGDMTLLCCTDEPLERNEINKDIKSWKQMGYTNLRCQDPVMMVCGKKVSDSVVEQINEIMVKIYNDPEMIEYMRKNGSSLKAYDLAKSQEMYASCFAVYDSVGASLGVKATR